MKRYSGEKVFEIKREKLLEGLINFQGTEVSVRDRKILERKGSRDREESPLYYIRILTFLPLFDTAFVRVRYNITFFKMGRG